MLGKVFTMKQQTRAGGIRGQCKGYAENYSNVMAE